MPRLPEHRVDVPALGEPGGEGVSSPEELLAAKVARIRQNVQQVSILESENDSLRTELAEIFRQLVGQRIMMGGKASFSIDPEFDSTESDRDELPVGLMEIDEVEESTTTDYGHEVFVVTHEAETDGRVFKYMFEVLDVKFDE